MPGTVKVVSTVPGNPAGLVVDAPLVELEARVVEAGTRADPTLLVVPMSVIGNWVKETERFAPELDVLGHHGPERLQGEAFVADRSDILRILDGLVEAFNAHDIDRIAWLTPFMVEEGASE